jgi:hypothetical protein
VATRPPSATTRSPPEQSFVLRRWQWLLVLGATTLLLGLGYLIFKKSLSLSSEAAGANGIVLSVWGLWISLAGFGITFWQLARTKSAAQAATEALDEVRSRVSTYDAVVETSRAIAFIRETQRHLKVPSWESAVVSYNGARESLVRLIELPSKIAQPDKDNLAVVLADITSLCDRIEAGLLRQRVTVDRGKALRVSKDHEELVLRLGIALQRELV